MVIYTGSSICLSHKLRGMAREGASTPFATLHYTHNVATPEAMYIVHCRFCLILLCVSHMYVDGKGGEGGMQPGMQDRRS